MENEVQGDDLPLPWDQPPAASQPSAGAENPAGTKKGKDPKEKLPDAATRLASYVLDPALGVELFRDEGGLGYMTAPVGGVRQTWLIGSSDSRQWLTRVYEAVEKGVL